MVEHDWASNLENNPPTPLGRLVTSSYLRYNPHFPDTPLRILGDYSLTLILEGEGHYRDANGYRAVLGPGDVALCFPDIATRFCPPRGKTWYELNAVFEGPQFDLLRTLGILNPDRPVGHLSPLADWHSRFHEIVCRTCVSDTDRLVQIADLAAFLTAAMVSDASPAVDQSIGGIMLRARYLLKRDVGDSVRVADVAQGVGMAANTFRKRFAKEVGVPPAKFRAQHRLDAAKSLLATSSMTCKEIAATAGFGSEFYFSSQFKQRTGMSPTQYRRHAKSVP
jgi:AraC-like DNA-binding protein